MCVGVCVYVCCVCVCCVCVCVVCVCMCVGVCVYVCCVCVCCVQVIKRIPLEGMRVEMVNDPDMRHGFQIISTCKSFRLEARYVQPEPHFLLQLVLNVLRIM